ncbi:hypothetical protein CAEBREN_12172 [Caenorhabditis brenneri]|uniref:Uncharacterized protein n=1 Tax=Caenorhabditis brenneri TaxID=135651 RepID=G0MBI1_CAEBE|nr:hypothetical protein CAEBREN_12172 [Caenorhabditis brenneri]
MFPNLEALNICKIKMYDADFASLCNDFPNLRTLNISGTKIKNLHGLAKLQKLEYLNIDGLLFETKEDIKDLFELKRLKHLAIGYIKWEEHEGEDTPELTTLMVNELEAVIRDFKLGRRVLPYPVALFLAKLPKIMDQDSLNVDKLRVLNMILMYWGHHLKRHTRHNHVILKNLYEGVSRLTGITENFNADKICSLTMRSIIYGGGFHEWEQLCAVIMDSLMDRMDLSSEYYKNINFRKLHETLTTMKNSARLLPESRASAASVLRFVELFM